MSGSLILHIINFFIVAIYSPRQLSQCHALINKYIMIIFEMRPLHVRYMTDGSKSTQTLIHQQMDISMKRITAKQMALTQKVNSIQFL